MATHAQQQARNFGSDISNTVADHDSDALPLAPHKLRALSKTKSIARQDLQEDMKNLRIKYNENLCLNRQKKAMRKAGPPAIFNPSLVSSGLNPFAAVQRQQTEFSQWFTFTNAKQTCRNHNCCMMVPASSSGWCKPCRASFSIKTDHKQVCCTPQCFTVVGRKNQQTGATKWCKECRRAAASSKSMSEREQKIPTLSGLRKAFMK